MNVFDLDTDLITRYEQFARSFTIIRADDLRQQIDAVYDSEKFWPEPLIALNPQFKHGRSLAELSSAGVVDPALEQVFALGQPRKAISLHCHQDEALMKALQRRNYIVTTGTGSGKSLCFFVPIIDRILKARRAGGPRGTRAIVIYPMNALANSQREELEKFIEGCGLLAELRPTFARYTGQEQDSERKRVAETAPDIILTNFMMLELLMTRQDDLDRQVIENMKGLEFLVLDELHIHTASSCKRTAVRTRRHARPAVRQGDWRGHSFLFYRMAPRLLSRDGTGLTALSRFDQGLDVGDRQRAIIGLFAQRVGVA